MSLFVVRDCITFQLNSVKFYSIMTKIQSENMEQNETSIREPSCVIAEHAFTVHFISHSCRVIMSAEVRTHWAEMKWDLCSEHIFFNGSRKLDLHQTMIIALICTFLMTSTQNTESLIDENMKVFFFVRKTVLKQPGGPPVFYTGTFLQEVS